LRSWFCLMINVLGLSHHIAPVEIREKFSIPQEKAKGFLAEMAGLLGFQEGLVLSTCNRLEMVIVTKRGGEGIAGLQKLMARIGGMAEQELSPYVHTFEGEAAVRHLFRVACSLDSMVLGEPQILGQVKDAYQQAVECRASGVVLNKLFHRSFSVAKRVRTETKIASHAVSVSFAAVELAKKILGNLEDKQVLLIGAGEMAELAARHFLNQGVGKIFITNRTHARALALADEFQGQAVPFADFPRELEHLDIILSSTGSSQFIIHKQKVLEVIRVRRNRPMFFIDIAVPRDIDPAIHEIDNVYVYDIDDLQGIVTANKGERKKEVENAEEIVEQGVEAFKEWLTSLEVVPTIQALRNRMENIRQKEVEKTLSRWKDATVEERKILEVLTQSIINKILHHPISQLKRQGIHNHGKLYLEITRQVFNLDEGKDEEKNETQDS
jgi:glutamyl-tRNA reductase